MKTKIKKIIPYTFIKFLLVGCVNTLVGMSVMMISYNVLHLNYWISSALNYITGSIVSFILNKRFTFKNKSNSKSVIIRFTVNIIVCYIVAYGIAKPLVIHILVNNSQSLIDNVSLIFGSGLFMLINYFGQKMFVFKESEINNG